MRIILLITLALAESRPQNQGNDGPVSIDRKQEIPYKITTIPFYGGAFGQALQLVETTDGIISSKIVMLPSTTTEPPDPIKKASEYEYPELPTRYEAEHGYSIRDLQKSAATVVKLQQGAQTGGLDSNQKAEYENEMEILNAYARNIADLQLGGAGDDFFNDEGLTAWFDRKRLEQSKKKMNSTQSVDESKKKDNKTSTGTSNKEEKKDKNKDNSSEREKHKEKQKPKNKEKEKDKDKEPEKEEQEEEEEEDGESVVVNLPPDDAAVAEAKPVGLAVAGAGGVAASKPVATAVAGPAGLAIARPVGTAIAGVDPDQALVPIFAEGYVKPTKKREPSSSKKQQVSSSDLLNKIISKYHQI